MNVNKADQKNKFSKIRSLPKQKVLKEAMKHLEEQKEEKEQKINADLGVQIEKTENKAKIEVSMINMNNQLDSTVRQHDIMRVS